MPEIDIPVMEQWIAEVARSHGKVAHELTYIFCDDEEIISVNRQYLQHDYYTDIITFDYTRGKLLRGDMYISLDTVASNAEAVGATYDQELRRVIIHGVLHLCGINDKGPGEREIMEMNENRALAMLENLNNF
ncbi:MAG: rRNA maturation RNase YbeY [Barnesiella sp.]|nr:rRNA maturation RNase YbeY [Barnesiella sp.]